MASAIGVFFVPAGVHNLFGIYTTFSHFSSEVTKVTELVKNFWEVHPCVLVTARLIRDLRFHRPSPQCDLRLGILSTVFCVFSHFSNFCKDRKLCGACHSVRYCVTDYL